MLVCPELLAGHGHTGTETLRRGGPDMESDIHDLKELPRDDLAVTLVLA